MDIFVNSFQITKKDLRTLGAWFEQSFQQRVFILTFYSAVLIVNLVGQVNNIINLLFIYYVYSIDKFFLHLLFY